MASTDHEDSGTVESVGAIILAMRGYLEIVSSRQEDEKYRDYITEGQCMTIIRDVLFEFHLKFWNSASIGIPVRSLL